MSAPDIPLVAGSPVSALTELQRWVAWRNEKRKGNGKWTKVPYAPHGGWRRAKTDDPRTWGSYDAACGMKGCEGPGLVLTGLPELVVLDLDGCRDPKTGRIEPWALAVCERAQSYTEVSPSGTGLHVLGVAHGLPQTITSLPRSDGQKLEIFTGGATKYTTVTWERLEEYPGELNDIGPLVRELLDEAEAGKRKSLPPVGPRLAIKGAARILEKLPNNYSRADWVRLGLAHKAGGGSFEDFDAWSAKHPSYDADETTRVWDSLQPNGGISPATLVFEARQHGIAVPTIPPSQDKLALTFAEQHGEALCFNHTPGCWQLWGGAAWREEATDLAIDLARGLCRETARTVSKPEKLEELRFINAVERLARSDRRLAVTHDVWNRDPFLFATPGGTVELRTGVVRPANPKDYINRVAAVAPAPLGTPTPRWTAFLDEITQVDRELQHFLQQWFGYSLTGDTREQALVFLYGPGGNGKSVLVNVIMRILGGYGATATMDTFLDSQGSRHSTELAMLDGARLVTASETDPGRYWAESRIKALTGGDPITARYMRQDNFTFTPVLKLTLIGNRKPSLHKVDDAARRRFNIVPLLYRPERVDHQLEEKLMAEAPGILRWLIDGCLDWQRNSLIRPTVVTAATEVYFEEQNLFDDWVAECCDLEPRNEWKSEAASALFSSWSAYAKAAGAHPGNKPDFGDRLVDLGCERNKGAKGIRLYRGIRLNPLPPSGGYL